jgi:hypothetical protein
MDHSRLDPTGAQNPGALRRGTAAALAVALALVTTTGCGTRQRYHPLPADTTAAVPADSIEAIAKNARDRWDAGAGQDAARLSASLVLADLHQVAPADWSDRERAFLDSLAIGAEVGSAPGALLVNFFSRSDPEHGSWPYLFWATDAGPRTQALEGRDLRFSDLATRPGPGAQPSAVAALFTRRPAGNGQPIVFAWKAAPGGTFTLAQTLGPDSLGGAGSGDFSMRDTVLVLQTRTYRTIRGFSECATCPHVYATHVFEWTPAGFVRRSDEEAPSPYSTFVRFVLALQAGDREIGTAQLTDPSLWDQARQFEWEKPKAPWRVAPSTDETAHEMTFLRGEKEAYRVSFEGRAGGWRISGIEATTPSVD